MVLQGLDEEGLHTRAVAVREGAPAAGKTLAELELRPDVRTHRDSDPTWRKDTGRSRGKFPCGAGRPSRAVRSGGQFREVCRFVSNGGEGAT